MVVAVVLGWLSVGVGLVLRYHPGTAAGATMAGVSVALFFVVLAAQELIAALRLRTPTPATTATPSPRPPPPPRPNQPEPTAQTPGKPRTRGAVSLGVRAGGER